MLLTAFDACGGGTLLTIVCAILAAYPLSRFRTRYRRPYLLTILFSTGLPITAIMVPVYGMFIQLNLVDTQLGTILFLATTGLPFAIWLMKSFMDGVPISFEEAAWTDGASNLQALRHVVLPLTWPGLAVVTIFTFIGMWGNVFPTMVKPSAKRAASRARTDHPETQGREGEGSGPAVKAHI